MKSMIKELWHGNIIPQEDSRKNSKEMKELLGYMARHHEDLAKTFTDEQKEIFEKFHDCWEEYVSLAEAAIFEYAFRLGARLAMEVQSDTTEYAFEKTDGGKDESLSVMPTTATHGQKVSWRKPRPSALKSSKHSRSNAEERAID